MQKLLEMERKLESAMDEIKRSNEALAKKEKEFEEFKASTVRNRSADRRQLMDMNLIPFEVCIKL